MAESEPRLQDHLSGVPSAALDRPCIDDHLKELALRLTDWQEIGLFLDLDEGEMEDIESSVRKVRARSLKMLRKWRNKCGENATYRYSKNLQVACFGNNELAKQSEGETLQKGFGLV